MKTFRSAECGVRSAESGMRTAPEVLRFTSHALFPLTLREREKPAPRSDTPSAQSVHQRGRQFTLSPGERVGVRGKFASESQTAPKPALHIDKPPHSRSAFTMIEIAICLAVIGFALAAIVGVLPLGMNVQRENREETVIGQDASVFLDAIRHGERGLDDLTNYVVAITNSWAIYTGFKKPSFHTNIYTYTGSWFDGSSQPDYRPMTNGLGIVGLLSTPRFVPFGSTNSLFFRSNYIVASVRSMSGDASEKFPQNNPDVQALAFSYRLITELAPYGAPYGTNYYDLSWIDPSRFPTNSVQYTNTLNYGNIVRVMRTNLYDLRLIFRYPQLPNGNVGSGRLVFRTSTSGHLLETNLFGFPSDPPHLLYFFEPRNYVKAQ